jgi:charged multivesicular body protein 7
VIESLTENQWAKGCIVTMANFQELCGGAETADIIKVVLALEGKAREIKVIGTDNIEGLKISLKENLVTAVSENDCHILQLHWTMEKLQQQYSILEQRVTISRASTVRAIKAGDKQAALRHARRWKTLNSSKERCGNFMDRIDEVLTSIADAEATQKVTDAVKVGASAIKEHHVTLDEVHTCLEELNQAISEQKETQEALGADFPNLFPTPPSFFIVHLNSSFSRINP